MGPNILPDIYFYNRLRRFYNIYIILDLSQPLTFSSWDNDDSSRTEYLWFSQKFEEDRWNINTRDICCFSVFPAD